MATAKSNKPGGGLWGWFGRQVGHVTKAIQTDVTKPLAPPQPLPPPAAPPQSKQPPQHQSPPSAPPPPADGPKVIYRQDQVEEMPHPDRPNVRLRRTVIDEVIVEEDQNERGTGGPPVASEASTDEPPKN